MFFLNLHVFRMLNKKSRFACIVGSVWNPRRIRIQVMSAKWGIGTILQFNVPSTVCCTLRFINCCTHNCAVLLKYSHLYNHIKTATCFDHIAHLQEVRCYRNVNVDFQNGWNCLVISKCDFNRMITCNFSLFANPGLHFSTSWRPEDDFYSKNMSPIKYDLNTVSYILIKLYSCEDGN
jgi:hypothetical protein